MTLYYSKLNFKKYIYISNFIYFFHKTTWSCLHTYFLKRILNFFYINFRNLRLNPLKDQRLNQNMNYVDWKTLTHPWFFITFENRKWTKLIRNMYYGMDPIRLIPPRNATIIFLGPISKHKWFPHHQVTFE